MPGVDIDRITDLVRAFALEIDVPVVGVEAGEVAKKWPYGLTARGDPEQGVILVVGPRFAELQDAEQEAALAWTLTSMATGLQTMVMPFLGMFFLTAVVLKWPADMLFDAVGAADLIADGKPWSMVAFFLLPALVAACVIGYIIWLLISTPWKRRVVYQTDRLVVERFGWKTMDTVLECDRGRLSGAAMERRMARLDRLRMAGGADGAG